MYEKQDISIVSKSSNIWLLYRKYYMISVKIYFHTISGKKTVSKTHVWISAWIQAQLQWQAKIFSVAEKPIFTAFSKHGDHFMASYRTLINVGITTIIISFTTTTTIFHWDPRFLSRYIDLPFHNTTIVRNRRRMTFKTSFITSKYLL